MEGFLFRGGFPGRFTEVPLPVSVLGFIVGDPGVDADEVRDEARDFALHDGGVAADDVLVLGLGDVILGDD